jgi:hypothetical protein
MDKLKHLGPTFAVAMIPVLLLTFRSMMAVRAVFFGAVCGLSFLAGESLARVLPRAAIIGWCVVSALGIVVVIASGWMGQDASVPDSLGKLALIAVAVGVPVRALIVQRWPGKAYRPTS